MGDSVLDDRSVVVIDGNDGTGKTTLVVSLRQLGYQARDRGLPTQATECDQPVEPVPREMYIILRATVNTSRSMLAARGADLTEKFHTAASLADYQQRFYRASREIGASFVDAEGTPAQTLSRVLEILREEGLKKPA